jgi:hypothetical protein
VADGDVVMICHHAYETPHPWGVLRYQGPFNPPARFTREDGTDGLCKWLLACPFCQDMPKGEIDYVETFWRNGNVHVTDFHKPPDALLSQHSETGEPKH